MKKALVLVLMTLVGIALAITPARASSWTDICGNGGTGYCLNDWGGGGNNGDAIKMYYGGYINDHFAIANVFACHDGSGAHDHIESDCLGGWGGMNNSNLIGALIVQIYDQNVGGECVATTTGAFAVLGTCANPADGTGGSIGVLMAVLGGSGCNSSFKQLFTDRYWDNLVSSEIDLISGGNVGVQAFYQGNHSGGPTCWGWISSPTIAQRR